MGRTSTGVVHPMERYQVLITEKWMISWGNSIVFSSQRYLRCVANCSFVRCIFFLSISTVSKQGNLFSSAFDRMGIDNSNENWGQLEPLVNVIFVDQSGRDDRGSPVSGRQTSRGPDSGGPRGGLRPPGHPYRPLITKKSCPTARTLRVQFWCKTALFFAKKKFICYNI